MSATLLTGIWLVVQTPTEGGISGTTNPINLELNLQRNGKDVELDTADSRSSQPDRQKYNQTITAGLATQYFWGKPKGHMDLNELTGIDLEVEGDGTYTPRAVWVFGTDGEHKFLLGALTSNTKSTSNGNSLNIPLGDQLWLVTGPSTQG